MALTLKTTKAPQSCTNDQQQQQKQQQQLQQSSSVTLKEQESASFENIPTFDFVMDHDQLMDGTRHVVEWAFPHWTVSEAKFVLQTHGLTNKLVKCKWNGETVLIRTYGKGTDAIIDRDQEMINFIALSRFGLCPKVHGRFSNGFIYGYMEGIPFTISDVRHPRKSSLVARHLAKWHRVNASDLIEPKPRLFETYNQWLSEVPKKFSNPSVEASVRAFVTVERLQKELTHLECELAKVNSPLVFSHGDVNPNNIIYNAATDKVDFIDYEYGAYNPRGFDIGNHFCEHAGFDCEWDLYPDKDFQRQFLRAYLEAWNEGVDDEKKNEKTEVTEEEIDRLYAEVNKYSLAANLGWSIWSLVQAEISDLEFDYVTYCKLRLDQYFRQKKQFLEL